MDEGYIFSPTRGKAPSFGARRGTSVTSVKTVLQDFPAKRLLVEFFDDFCIFYLNI